MRYTFKELKDGMINEIPTSSGVYWVLIPEKFCIKYMEETDGPTYGKKGNKMAYTIDKLEKWGAHYFKEDRGGNILYIGKATNLQNRIQQYLDFGYNDEKYLVHEGGRAIWQLENNKDLLITYKKCQDEEKIEAELIDKYIMKYGEKPFANQRRGKKQYRLF
jgi:hypothetical protein